MNYLQKFLDMLDSGYLEQLLKITPGSSEAETAKNEFIKMIEKGQKGAEMVEKFTNCLALHQELWFNMGWSPGWSAGASTIVKLAGLDTPEISKIMQAVKFNTE
ncbi:MAG: hypothetical protein KAW12_25585 [Candidatus Aminicenantes bacterium]|nr:hypothetical protein [Candidatus Aminicenantes bacterium]